MEAHLPVAAAEERSGRFEVVIPLPVKTWGKGTEMDLWVESSKFHSSTQSTVGLWSSAYSHPDRPPHRSIQCRVWGQAWPPAAARTGRKTLQTLAAGCTGPLVQEQSEEVAGKPAPALAHPSAAQKHINRTLVQLSLRWQWRGSESESSEQECSIMAAAVSSKDLSNPGRHQDSAWKLPPQQGS